MGGGGGVGGVINRTFKGKRGELKINIPFTISTLSPLVLRKKQDVDR